MAAVKDLLQFQFAANDRTRVAFSGLNRSLDRTDKRTARLSKRFAGLGTRLGKLGRAFGGIGAIAGGVSLTAGMMAARRAMGDLDALSKQITTSGLSSDLFQTLQFATEEASISQERLNAATLKFTAGIGELRGGFGTLTTSLKKLNPGLADQLILTRDNDEAFKIFADAVKGASDQSEKLALVSAITGKRASEMVRVFELGSAGFASTGQRARELGVIFEKDLLLNAEKLENRFGVAAFTINRKFKTALVELAPIIVSTVEGLVSFTGAMARNISRLGEFFRLVRLGGKEVARLDAIAKESKVADIGTGIEKSWSKVPPAISNATLQAIKWNTTVTQSPAAIQRLESAAQSFGATATGAFQALVFEGGKFSDILSNIGKQLASAALQKGLTNLFLGAAGGAAGGGGGFFSSLLGFASGGSFKVGGTGGTDSQLVAFRASPNERVSVTKPGQGGAGVNITINAPIDARGAQRGVAEQLSSVVPAIMEAAAERAVAKVRTERILRPGFA